MPEIVNPEMLSRIYRESGPKGLMDFIRLGLKDKKFTAENFSFRHIALATGVLNPYYINDATPLREALASSLYANLSPETIVRRAHSEWTAAGENFSHEAITTSIFPVVTGELLSAKIIEGYQAVSGIARELVTVVPTRIRNQKMSGFTSLGGALDVAENNPYEETGFDEKYVVTAETKRGRVLSISEELIMFDQTGEIFRRANMLGDMLAQDWERTVVRGVIDANAGSGVYVWRPSGTGATLYATSGANKNYIGSGGVTGFNAASPLVDWTDIDFIRQYRATQIKDDRTDGTQLPIGTINQGLTMLCPEKIAGTAASIVNATEVVTEGATTSAHQATTFANPVRGVIGKVLSSPYLDEVNGDDYYVGQFQKQFMWTEVFPLQTFLQGANSEAAFDRDVALRVKARYFGGLTAIDTIYVTKVDGA